MPVKVRLCILLTRAKIIDMAKRIWATVPDEFYEKFVGWCDKLALQQSQLGGMAIQAGLDNIARAVSPVESMSPTQWANILKAMAATGQPVVLPDGTVIGSEELAEAASKPRVGRPEKRKAAAKKVARKHA